MSLFLFSSDLSDYLHCLCGLYFVQDSLFLDGRTRSSMTGVSKAIKRLFKEANNRKVAPQITLTCGSEGQDAGGLLIQSLVPFIPQHCS